MKIICTDEERKKLSMNHTDVTTDGKEINVSPPVINISIIPPIEEDDESE